MKRFGFARREGAATGKRRITFLLRLLAGVGVLLVGILLGFYLFCPVDLLKDRLERELSARTSWQVHLKRLTLTVPPGLRVEGVDIAGGLPPGLLSPLAEVTVKPLWGALLSGQPGLELTAHRKDGALNLEWRRNGSLEGSAEAFPLTVPLTANGKLKASGTLKSAIFRGAWPLGEKTESRLELTLTGVTLEGLKDFGSARDNLPIGTVTLTMKGQGKVLEVQKLESSGGDLQLSGEGQIMLASPLGLSRANLTLGVKPAPNLDQALRDLLGLLAQPGRDGIYNIRLRGSLAQAGLG